MSSFKLLLIVAIGIPIALLIGYLSEGIHDSIESVNNPGRMNGNMNGPQSSQMNPID